MKTSQRPTTLAALLDAIERRYAVMSKEIDAAAKAFAEHRDALARILGYGPTFREAISGAEQAYDAAHHAAHARYKASTDRLRARYFRAGTAALRAP